MDSLYRASLPVRPLRLTFILVGLLLALTVGAQMGSFAQEGTATPEASPGASPEASPEASPVASPVAGSSSGSGTLTLRVLGCDEGTTADTAGPTSCTALSGDVAVEVAGGSGEALTVDDSLRLSSGVFRWLRLPFDTYTVTFESLPDGYTSALGTGETTATPVDASESGFDVTVDPQESSPTFTVYLIP